MLIYVVDVQEIHCRPHRYSQGYHRSKATISLNERNDVHLIVIGIYHLRPEEE